MANHAHKNPVEARLAYVENHIADAEDKAYLLQIGVAALGDPALSRTAEARIVSAETLMQYAEKDSFSPALIDIWSAACLARSREGRDGKKAVKIRLNKHITEPASPFQEKAAAVHWEITHAPVSGAAKALVNKLKRSHAAITTLDNP